ncbi:hypothetical protein [cf. Phormidesmis sp. LEGE 11477]|uniref:hypothetical protein n=1 Tax=cf. Phormidesmis sp. LEGE 11477 TaxID=1828680 RepID=UPI001D139608|nr:hypothetical protein [cf. Phormidesmis sp. LEGE 11477]
MVLRVKQIVRKLYRVWLPQRLKQKWLRIAVLSCFLLVSLHSMMARSTMAQSAAASMNRFCQISEVEAQSTESLRLAGLQGDEVSQRQYEMRSRQHAEAMRNCRRTQWPENQAVWLRLYPCDLRPGGLDTLMDRIVNLGYNQVYIEAFSNGQVLLPKNDNPTVWPSVVQAEEFADRDLLAEAIAAARARSLDAYAWMFTLNFGYSYGQRSDRRQVLARNGRGSDTLDYANNGKSGKSEEVFIDPYNRVAQQDYQQMVQAVLARKPDGALYDYVRYPRLVGGNSVASRVKDLWIYGPAARQALVQRGTNGKGRALIQRFMQQGYLTDTDVSQTDSLYPSEGEPLWQSRTPAPVAPDDLAPASERRPGLQLELWRLSVAHAIQGVVDFLQAGATSARQAGIPAGAVFFPNGNRAIGNGYDSRLQHWNRFPEWLDFHPMAYAVCGNTNCIVDEIRRVLNVRRNPATVKPALAGAWGITERERPSLEAQMDALQRSLPQLKTVSHFSFDWLDAEFNRSRKFCSSADRRIDREVLLRSEDTGAAGVEVEGN